MFPWRNSIVDIKFSRSELMSLVHMFSQWLDSNRLSPGSSSYHNIVTSDRNFSRSNLISWSQLPSVRQWVSEISGEGRCCSVTHVKWSMDLMNKIYKNKIHFRWFVSTGNFQNPSQIYISKLFTLDSYF